MKKKIKSILATSIVMSGGLITGWIILKEVFIEPIREIFEGTRVTFDLVAATLCAYFALFFFAYLLLKLFKWAFENI